MSNVAIASFRKVTPGVLASARLAMTNDIPKASKGEVAIALKRAARPLGIDGTAYHVLDILLGLSKARDWEAGNRPVVAISNEKLAEYVGRSERTVMRALKRLVEAGILAYRDSSTGRRWVHRDGSGAIARAYGLDFRPAQVRYEEICALADAYKVELNAEREARHAVIRLSRAIADALDAAALDGGPDVASGCDLSAYRRRLDAVMATPCPAQDKAADLDELYEALVAQIADGCEPAAQSNAAPSRNEEQTHHMTGAGDIGVTPLFITNTQSLRNPCNQNRTSAHAADHQFASDGGFAPEWLLKKEQAARHEHQTDRPNKGKNRQKASYASSTHLCDVSIHLIETSCGTLRSELGLSFESWAELCDGAETLRLAIGLSQSAYHTAADRLGRQTAAAILAVVAEKAMRDPERIGSPGGYFRAMVERAGEGRLNLARSLFGLAAR